MTSKFVSKKTIDKQTKEISDHVEKKLQTKGQIKELVKIENLFHTLANTVLKDEDFFVFNIELGRICQLGVAKPIDSYDSYEISIPAELVREYLMDFLDASYDRLRISLVSKGCEYFRDLTPDHNPPEIPFPPEGCVLERRESPESPFEPNDLQSPKPRPINQLAVKVSAPGLTDQRKECISEVCKPIEKEDKKRADYPYPRKQK